MSLLNVNKIAPQSGTDFTLGDSGDTFTVPSGATLTVAGTFTQTGAQTFDGGVDIDNFNINGTTIALSSGDMTLDVAGDIILNTDDGIVRLADASVVYGELTNSSSDFVIQNKVDAKDIIFKQFDGTTTLTLDDDTTVKVATDLTVGDDLSLITDSAVLKFGADGDTSLTHTDGTGLTLNSTNKLCFNDATQFIQGASGTVLNIAATDEIDLTATAVDLNGNLDVSGTTLLPTLGVVTAKDLGVGAHIRISDTGASVNSGSDALVIEDNGGDMGMTLLSSTSGEGRIAFGDSGGNSQGQISYAHNGDSMRFYTAASERVRITSAGCVGMGTAGDSTRLKVEGSTDSEKMMQLRHGDADNPNGMEIQYFGGAPDDNGKDFYRAEDTGATRFEVTSDGDVRNHDNAYGATSDQRIKQDITDSGSQWDDIKAIKVRKYKKKDDVRQYGNDAWVQLGVIAQELETSNMDKLVRETTPSTSDILSDSSFGTLVDDTDNPNADGSFPKKVGEVKAKVKSVQYSILYMKAIKCLQEAMTKIETLETENTDIKARIKTLEDA